MDAREGRYWVPRMPRAQEGCRAETGSRGAAGLPGTLQTLPTLQNPDLGALLVFTLLGLVFLRTERTLRRWEEAVLLGSYATHLTLLGLG